MGEVQFYFAIAIMTVTFSLYKFLDYKEIHLLSTEVKGIKDKQELMTLLTILLRRIDKVKSSE
jgi:hypothetical protein